MTIRRLLIVVTLLSLVAAAYVVYTNSNRPAAAATTPGTQTATVTRGNLIATVNSAGPVAAKKQAALNFGTGGTVKALYVRLGDSVKAGQVLAEVDATDLQMALANSQLSFNQQQLKYDQTAAGATDTELATARQSVASAQDAYDSAVRKFSQNDAQRVTAKNTLEKASLALQKAESDYAKATADRVTDLTSVTVALKQAQMDYAAAEANYKVTIENLGDDSAVRSAARALQNAKDALATLEAKPTADDLESAKAQLEQARLNLQQAQLKMRNAQIVAPFDGTVTQVNIDVDNTVGTNVTNGAIQLSLLKELQVTVNMAEVDIGKIKLGQDVNLTFDALTGGPTIAGKVTQIALVGVTTQGVVNYPVIISLTPPDQSPIKTGMTANVQIVVDRRENVLLVPNRAVRTVNRQRQVTVQGPAGVAVPTVVTIGLQNDTQSEVLSGLQEGQVVILATTQTRPTTGQGGFGGAAGGGPGGPVFIQR